MAKFPIIFTLLLSLSTLMSHGQLQSLSQENVKTTIIPFRLYLQQTLGGPDGNLYEVARAAISTVPTSFGIVYVTDGVITAGPDPNSQKLGRVQGTVTTVGLSEEADVLNYSFLINAGKYRGSSLIVSGRRLIFVANQEIPIAGGTGFFRGARGYVLSSFIPTVPATDARTTFEFVFYVVGVN